MIGGTVEIADVEICPVSVTYLRSHFTSVVIYLLCVPSQPIKLMM